MSVLTSKRFGATLSVALNCFLILLKLIVGITTHSVGVLASAIDSIIDLIASLLAYFAILVADAPPDQGHPFGHGKFEDFAGLVEAVLIVIGAVVIIWEAFNKLFHPAIQPVEPLPGIIVMAVALVLDLVVSWILFKIAKNTESTALHADAHHLSTDVWTSLAVIAGLALVHLTGNPVFDPATALLVAGLILFIGGKIVRQVFNHLVDAALPGEEAAEILELIREAVPAHEPIMIADLKTRRAGSNRLIVFNLQVAPQLTVQQAHDYCDRIESALAGRFPNSIVNIHLEPLPLGDATPQATV